MDKKILGVEIKNNSRALIKECINYFLKLKLKLKFKPKKKKNKY